MFQDTSLRKIAFLLLGPFLYAIIQILFTSYMNLQAARMGIPPKQLMLLAIAFAAGYAPVSYLSGHICNQRNSTRFMFIAVIAATLVGILCLYFRHFYLFCLFSLLIGLISGIYFVPFQINMSHVKPFRTLAWSVAFYNISWGTGAAIGFFAGPALRESPIWIIIAIALSVLILHHIILFISNTAPPPTHQAHTTAAFSSTPRLRYISWISVLATGILFSGTLTVLLPALGNQRHWSDQQIGLGLFCVVAMIALCAPLWALLRNLMTRPYLIIAAVTLGIAAFSSLPFTTSYPLSLVILSLLGITHSCVVYHAIYYSNADPTSHEKSIGIAEALAGIFFMLGPLIMGLTAWNNPSSTIPYFTGSAILLTALIAIFIIWLAPTQKIKKHTTQSPNP